MASHCPGHPEMNKTEKPGRQISTMSECSMRHVLSAVGSAESGRTFSECSLEDEWIYQLDKQEGRTF